MTIHSNISNMGFESQPSDILEPSYVTQNVYVYAQPITIQHWQLRDLVTTNVDTDELLVVQESCILRYNRNKRQAFVAQRTDFLPCSLSCQDGILVSGGQASQLKVTRLFDNQTLWHDNVGGTVNNGIALYRDAGLGEYRLLVANNDESIKVFGLDTMEKLDTIQCGSAVNATAVSPDGKWMVAGVDASSVRLYSISPSGDYELREDRADFKDSVMSCAWSPNSMTIAAAGQDGQVVVYDIRNFRPLAKIKSVQQRQVKGACRCVKFASVGELDLLAFTEHMSYLHLVDTRTDYSEKQVVRVCPSMRDVNISGLAFSKNNSTICVGTDASIFEYQIDTVNDADLEIVACAE
eukprot:CAMPEP_0184693408 /NCGR_PEP_ID=MMETSP0313-20130426/1640_1 /TAXON_ID=2792 /ORGANISM="Porphyridium aerugineum, Strain SAG 1380-2" /LENGTH=350 /DNA_ID=CAMNT_0027151483 /DNA_START=286 /DNA_END=1339 /DNA_ORIENTATION=+